MSGPDGSGFTIESELARLFGSSPAAGSTDMTATPSERRAAWIREQRLSPAEAVEIPPDYDPAYPYPREPSTAHRSIR